jgi:3-deoxy-7-phosphoheptulonate synthase
MDSSPNLDYVRDRRIEKVIPLASPIALLEELPLSQAHIETVLRGRAEIVAILNKTDDRLLVIVGPCSIHDVDAALEYARRLRSKAGELARDLCVVMRVYFEKPRTTTGWKGLINDPHLDGSGDVNSGLRMARGLLLEILQLGLPAGCEILDPITPQYIADTVSWAAIGARTTESQIHRQMASGLSMPVGFKNRTDGNIDVAVDAVRAAAAPHSFASIDFSGSPVILHTSGNSDGHIILRGGRNNPNHGAAPVGKALQRLGELGLPQRLVIDASHDNSGKDHRRQPQVAGEIAAQIAAGNRGICGVMAESFLVGGRQALTAGTEPVYGQSVTDACMGWEATVEVLDVLAGAVRARRKAAA